MIRPLHTFYRTLACSALALLFMSTQAQVLLDEQFTGGASTTGFTIESVNSDCDWTFAPGGLTATTFSVDGGGVLPSGAGFDDDFAFLDSDACGPSGITVNSTLISSTFDASGASVITLSFSHQFQARLQSFCKVEAFDGSTWTEIVTYTGTSVGYPNPAATAVHDITAATGGSSVAQVRFQFSSGWDWWWALDNILVVGSECSFPSDLAVTGVTSNGATVEFTPNGSPSYEWVITDGSLPGGGGDVVNGTMTGEQVMSLMAGTSYTVFVRSICDGGGSSPWSTAVNFVTPATNDECITAIPIMVNDDLDCEQIMAGTVVGATPSNITSTCFGTPDDDVWFSFTAQATSHRVSLINLGGSTTDLYHALWIGGCDGLTLVPGSCSDPQESNPTGLVIGTTYYLQVYTWTSSPDQTSVFDVCIGTDPAIGINDDHGIATMRVFPNPAQDVLTIDVADASVQRVRVLDASGRVARDIAFRRTMDIGQLDPGSYTLLMLDRDASIIGRSRFVKE
ncbi:MAG TPA: hypothetical protein PKJ19_03425 [Flavobacteriales bacterium]|nr:hypothetical protein [Flavobacteriales bacterium]HNU56401.1 hypothetical protein [Flavobacteriales bacterium]